MTPPPIEPPVLTGQALIDDINACELRDGQSAFWWLGQHTFVVKVGRTIVWIDPYLSPSKARRVPPLVEPREVTNAQVIIGTHDHGDHIDRKIWPDLAQASPGATFVVPQLLRERIVKELNLPDDRVKGIDDGRPVEVARLKISAIPAAHEFLDRDEATGLHPFLGVVIEGNGAVVYHPGDTCLYDGIHAKLRPWQDRIDAAFLPINGRDGERLARKCYGNLTFQEAADLAGFLRPGLTIPTHWDMFAGNTEDPTKFIDYMKVKYPELRTQIGRYGQRMVVGA